MRYTSGSKVSDGPKVGYWWTGKKNGKAYRILSIRRDPLVSSVWVEREERPGECSGWVSWENLQFNRHRMLDELQSGYLGGS